jgi:hypothetical protein
VNYLIAVFKKTNQFFQLKAQKKHLRWNANLESVKECSFNSSTASTPHGSNPNLSIIQKRHHDNKHKSLRRSSSHGDISQILIESETSEAETKLQDINSKRVNLNKFYINIMAASTRDFNIQFDQNNNGIRISGWENRSELDIDSLNSILESAISSIKLKLSQSIIYEKPRNAQKNLKLQENIREFKSYLTQIEHLLDPNN